VRVAPEVAARTRKALAEKHPFMAKTLNKQHFFNDDSSGNNVQVNMTDFYEFALIANVSVGTPAQNFSVKFDIWSSDLSVVDTAAAFDSADYGCADSSASNICSSENSNIQKKNLYNTSASSTFVATKKKFTGWEQGDTGKQVKDVFTEGTISATLNFGDLTQVGFWLDVIPVMDGVLGLSAAKSSNKGMTNVLGQLASTLASPVVTIHINRSIAEYINNVKYPHTDAEYLFGSNALPQCNQANWQTINLFKPFAALAIANATGITYDGADANGCNTNIGFNNGGKLILPIDSFAPLEVSVQAFEVFRQATNAKFDYKVGWYTTDCNSLGSIPNVNIGLSDGNTLALKPADYIIQYKKKCLLFVYGDYDEKDGNNDWNPLILGQSWLNNHCISYDINANTLAITDAVPNNGN